MTSASESIKGHSVQPQPWFATSRSLLAMLLVGFLQGLLLLFVAEGVRGGDSAVEDFRLVAPLYAIAFGVPTAFLLCFTGSSGRRLWLIVAAYGLILGLTGYYTGAMVGPEADHGSGSISFAFSITALVAWHVALPFAQSFINDGFRRPAYAELFHLAWNNLLTLSIAGLFVAILAALFTLWASLFKVIGIDVFQKIFTSPQFVYPTYATAFAFAVLLGRRHVAMIITIRSVILAIFKALLPLLALISVLFLAALPFVGLAPLWETGRAAALLLIVMTLSVIFVNAVFQDGLSDAPYSAWLRGVLRFALTCLPVYVILCGYALLLRIEQHGLSVDRYWAVMLCLIVGLYVVGYAAVALRPGQRWMGRIPQVNIALAVYIIVLFMLVNSPVLDAQRLSVNSQVNRLLTGKVDIEHFDFDYLRFELGARGVEALKMLQESKHHPQSERIRARASLSLAKTSPYQETQAVLSPQTEAEAAAHFVVFPSGHTLDPGFLGYAMDRTKFQQHRACYQPGRTCPILRVDINGDGVDEYVVFNSSSDLNRVAHLYVRDGKGWREKGSLVRQPSGVGLSSAEIDAALRAGQYEVVATPWRDLVIGSVRYILSRDGE